MSETRLTKNSYKADVSSNARRGCPSRRTYTEVTGEVPLKGLVLSIRIRTCKPSIFTINRFCLSELLE